MTPSQPPDACFFQQLRAVLQDFCERFQSIRGSETSLISTLVLQEGKTLNETGLMDRSRLGLKGKALKQTQADEQIQAQFRCHAEADSGSETETVSVQVSLKAAGVRQFVSKAWKLLLPVFLRQRKHPRGFTSTRRSSRDTESRSFLWTWCVHFISLSSLQPQTFLKQISVTQEEQASAGADRLLAVR